MSNLEGVEIAYPQQPHAATILLLDVSGSMAGEKIRQLNEGLQQFLTEVQRDPLASRRVDLAVVTFGSSVEVVRPFAPVTADQPITLTAGGITSMGGAIRRSMQMLQERKRQYQAEGTAYYRPWLILLTDGAPTDMQVGDPTFAQVARELQGAIANGELLFYPVGVGEEADFHTLRELVGGYGTPLALKGMMFAEFFQWLSNSQRKVSMTQVGERVTLDSPLGWGEVPTD